MTMWNLYITVFYRFRIKVLAIWYMFSFLHASSRKKKTHRIRCDLRDRPILRGKTSPEGGNFNLTSQWKTCSLHNWTDGLNLAPHFFPTKEKRSSRILSNLKHFHFLLWFRNAARTNLWFSVLVERNLHPENLHGTWKSLLWKGKSSSKPSFFLAFHVNFRGCDAWRFWTMGTPPQDLFLLGSLSPLNHHYGSKVFLFKQLEHAPGSWLATPKNYKWKLLY